MTADIPGSVIVAVRDEDSAFQCDFELPTQQKIGDLTKGLLRLLREFELNRYGHKTAAELWSGSRRLADDQTLASADIWDGAELRLHFPSAAYSPAGGLKIKKK